jgi:hypothetical protein
LAFNIPQAKVSATPTPGWNKTYGGTDADGAYSLVQTSDGGYALAGVGGYSEFCLVKADGSGNMQLNQTYGIPEFPSFLVLPLFATLTMLAVVLAKKKTRKVGT